MRKLELDYLLWPIVSVLLVWYIIGKVIVHILEYINNRLGE
jgi:hypothetical protein